jgi:hypothetical protein
MDESLEKVRRDIENTRFALGEKLGRLENKIETTTTTTLNPAYYVRTRPWPTLGIVVLGGWLVGRALRSNGAKKNVAAAPTGVANDALRSAVSGAAGIIGVIAGDLLRDFIRDRRARTLSYRANDRV